MRDMKKVHGARRTVHGRRNYEGKGHGVRCYLFLVMRRLGRESVAVNAEDRRGL